MSLKDCEHEFTIMFDNEYPFCSEWCAECDEVDQYKELEELEEEE